MKGCLLLVLVLVTLALSIMDVQAGYTKNGWVFNDNSYQYNRLESYEKNVQDNPENPKAWYNEASALKRMERYDKAITAIERAIELDPAYAKAWNVKGDILRKMGKNPEADAAYARAKSLGG
jgi:tetratricopeptide (TPR) repeat protein